MRKIIVDRDDYCWLVKGENGEILNIDGECCDYYTYLNLLALKYPDYSNYILNNKEYIINLILDTKQSISDEYREIQEEHINMLKYDGCYYDGFD